LTSDKKNKRHFKQIAGISFSVILSAVFLYIAFHGVNFSQVLNILSDTSLIWIFIYILVWFTSHYIRAARWKVILHSVKPDMSVMNVLGSLMAGYGVNNVVPRMGEISRAVLLGKWEKTSRTSILGTIFVERIIDMIFLAIAMLIAITLWGGNLYEHFPWLKSAIILTSLLLAALIIMLLLIIRFKSGFSNIIIKITGKVSAKLAGKVTYIFDMLIAGFSSLKGTRNYVITFILSVLLILSYALTTYVGFYTIGMNKILPVTFTMAWVLMSVSAIGIVIPTPGGTGSYHTLAKSVLVLIGFSEEISLAYAVLTHIVQYILFILLAIFFFLWLNSRSSKLYGVKEKFSDLIEETKLENL